MLSLLLLFATVIYVRGNGDGDQSGGKWGYDDDNGPATWPGVCQIGRRQSPIDIRPTKLEFINTSDLIFVNYNFTGEVQVQNTGRSVSVIGFHNWAERPSISGGGLSSDYILDQFHLHWGAENDDGSEHTFGALHYPLELHLVHVKRGLSQAEALEECDGLAVVAVFFAKSDNGSALKPLEQAFAASSPSNGSASVGAFRADGILPPSRDVFYRYDGSLTTPPCSQAVIWTLLAEPLFVSKNQLQILRQYVNLRQSSLLSNRRPTMPLQGRKVFVRQSSVGTHFIPAACTVFILCILTFFDKI